MTYIGHAALLVELGEVRVLTDPVLRRRIAHIRRHVPLPSIQELAPLDAVVISHAHHDHLDPVSLWRVGRGCPVVVPRGYARFLRLLGMRDAIELDVGERTEVAGITIEAVPARHDVRRYRIGRRRDAIGYLLNGPARVYFAGDTDLYQEMEDLKGRVDVALLPVSGWGPRVGPGHLDPERAARAVALIQPQVAIPIHWGTLSAGSSGRTGTAAPRAFEQAVSRVAPQVTVCVLAPGERFSF